MAGGKFHFRKAGRLPQAGIFMAGVCTSLTTVLKDHRYYRDTPQNRSLGKAWIFWEQEPHHSHLALRYRAHPKELPPPHRTVYHTGSPKNFNLPGSQKISSKLNLFVIVPKVIPQQVLLLYEEKETKRLCITHHSHYLMLKRFRKTRVPGVQMQKY